MASCAKEVEDVYTKGESDDPNCMAVSFPNQDAAGSHTFDPTAQRIITFTAKRSVTTGDITVPVEVVDTAGVFNVGAISFADGQEETTFDVTFDEAKVGVKYGLAINITDPKYALIYGSGATSIKCNVLVVSWIDFMDPKTNKPAVFTINSRWDNTFGPMQATLKYYEVGGVRTGVFTSIDTDKDGKAQGFWHSDPSVELNIRWYTEDQDGLSHKNDLGYDFVELEKQYFGYDYNNGDWLAVPLEDAVTPIYVYDYAWYWVERGYDWGSSGMGSNWLDEANNTGKTTGNYPVGYYDGNGAFFFNIYFYMPGLGGWSPDNYGTVAIASGFDRTDYSIKEVETDYSSEGYTPVYIETGKDVSYIKYAIYPGELTSTQAANKAPLIADGTDESVKFDEFELDEDEGVLYATLQLAPEATGDYTFVAVSFDSKGEAKDAGYVIFHHIAAEDVEKYEVKVSVFTEETPARYATAGYNEYNSFAYGVSGEDLTEVHAIIVKASSLGNNLLYALKEDKDGDYTVSDDVLAKINAVGGYYDAIGGLDAGTEYAVVIWATNGDMDDFAYATFATTESPEVWEPYGTATWTDAFVGPWFSNPALTYDVALERSVDDPTRFRLVNVYGAAFPYNEEGDWDDSKDYYLVINTADPEYTYFEYFDTGCNWGYGDFILTTQIARYLGTYELDFLKANGIPGATYADNKITFEYRAILKAMANYNNGGWYYGNNDADNAYSITFNPDATLEEAEAPALLPSIQKKSVSSVHNYRFTGKELKGERRVFEREAKPVKVAAKVSYTRMAKENKMTSNSCNSVK